MSLKVGKRAPDFELNASGGGMVSLAELVREGPTVLFFVPLAFTPVCTNELGILRDKFEWYTSRGVKVVAASVDSQYTLKVWADQLKLPFPLLSDFNREAARAYGVLYEDLQGLRGVAKRSAFVIDRQGVVRYRWVSEDASMLPPLKEINAAVEQLVGA
jgi:peroxiredoxin